MTPLWTLASRSSGKHRAHHRESKKQTSKEASPLSTRDQEKHCNCHNSLTNCQWSSNLHAWCTQHQTNLHPHRKTHNFQFYNNGVSLSEMQKAFHMLLRYANYSHAPFTSNPPRKETLHSNFIKQAFSVKCTYLSSVNETSINIKKILSFIQNNLQEI